MILYIKCACRTQDKLLIKKYKDLGFEIRNISKNPAYRKEIKEFPYLRLPFIIAHGIASNV